MYLRLARSFNIPLLRNMLLPRHIHQTQVKCHDRLNFLLTACQEKQRCMKVTVIGAGGTIGEIICMMLKQCSYIDEVYMFDVKNIDGLSKDISQLDTACRVCTSVGEYQLRDALYNARVVVMAAAVPFKSGMTLQDHFVQNALLARTLSEISLEVCPDALIAVMTSPVNSLVPIITELFQRDDHRTRVFGITVPEMLNASAVLAEAEELESSEVCVPVIGGCSSETVVPVFSQARSSRAIKIKDFQGLIQKVRQSCYDKVIFTDNQHKVSCAYAATRFTISLCKAILGFKGVSGCAYVRSNKIDGCPYFGSYLELGTSGVMKYWDLPSLSEQEQNMLYKAVLNLKFDIERGMSFIQPEGSTLKVQLPNTDACRAARFIER